MAVGVAVRRPSGTGSVYRRRDGRWVAEVRDGPLRRRRLKYGKSRESVEAWLNQLLSVERSGRGVRNPIVAANLRGIVLRALAMGRERGWDDDHLSDVIVAWMAPARVRAGVWGPCVYCGTDAASTVDHRTPLSRGGTDDGDNLVSACFDCNVRKGKRTADEYATAMDAGRKPA